MSEEQTDTTSFASILLGVKRLRDESNEKEIESRFNRGKEQDQEQGPAPKVTQRPFTEGERIVPNIRNVSRDKEARYQSPTASVPMNASTIKYQRPEINRTLINNNARRTTFTNIQVSVSQKGNPLLTTLKVPYEYNEKLKNCDYMINTTSFVLFLSLKYHKLHPEYVYTRVKKLNGPGTVPLNNNMKVLLCLVDVENNDDILRELNKICLLNDLSLVLAWSFEEAANYINYLKQLENSNTHTSIKGVSNDDDYYLTLSNTLTAIKQINKTDAVNLITKYGSFKDLVTLSNEDDLAEVQGMGKVKVAKFLASLEQNFILNKQYPERKRKTEQSVDKDDTNPVKETAEPPLDDEYELFMKSLE